MYLPYRKPNFKKVSTKKCFFQPAIRFRSIHMWCFTAGKHRPAELLHAFPCQHPIHFYWNMQLHGHSCLALYNMRVSAGPRMHTEWGNGSLARACTQHLCNPVPGKNGSAWGLQLSTHVIGPLNLPQYFEWD